MTVPGLYPAAWLSHPLSNQYLLDRFCVLAFVNSVIPAICIGLGSTCGRGCGGGGGGGGGLFWASASATGAQPIRLGRAHVLSPSCHHPQLVHIRAGLVAPMPSAVKASAPVKMDLSSTHELIGAA